MRGTPMAIDRETDVIYINPDEYRKLSLSERKFWTWHEKAHAILDTDDEVACDTYAFRKLAGSEYRSLRQMIEAEEKLLVGDKDHQRRIDNIYRLAVEWDKEHPERISRGRTTRAAISSLTNAMTAQSASFTAALDKIAVLLEASGQHAENTQQSTGFNMYYAIGAILLIMLLK